MAGGRRRRVRGRQQLVVPDERHGGVELRGAYRDIALRDLLLELEVLDQPLLPVVVFVEPRIRRNIAFAAGGEEHAPFWGDGHVPYGVMRHVVRQQMRDARLRDQPEERRRRRFHALERVVGMARGGKVGGVGEVNGYGTRAQRERKGRNGQPSARSPHRSALLPPLPHLLASQNWQS